MQVWFERPRFLAERTQFFVYFTKAWSEFIKRHSRLEPYFPSVSQNYHRMAMPDCNRKASARGSKDSKHRRHKWNCLTRRNSGVVTHFPLKYSRPLHCAQAYDS